VDWLNQQDISTDPELQSALGKENLFFEERLTIGETDICLVGKLESKGWKIDSRSQDQNVNLKFRLSRSLTRDQAIEQAIAYVESKAGPQFKNLSENEERMIERMSVANRVQAFVFYMQARLPDELAERFLRIGATGDDLAILRFAANENISSIAEEAVAHCFYWSNPRATGEFFDWVRANDDGRMWTFALRDSLWARYQVASAVDRLDAQDVPTQQDLDQMSDDEIEKTLTEARKLRARNQIR
jgi:hypothetical protein